MEGPLSFSLLCWQIMMIFYAKSKLEFSQRMKLLLIAAVFGLIEAHHKGRIRGGRDDDDGGDEQQEGKE